MINNFELDINLPYKVADISLAAWGRKEIRLAEGRNAGLNGYS